MPPIGIREANALQTSARGRCRNDDQHRGGRQIAVAGASRMGCTGGARADRMLSNSRTVRIEWGDCDPAGIVFYPRYFAMFDHSTTLLVERALGMRKHQISNAYAFDGHPVVGTQARFLVPARYGDDVVIETSLTAVRRSSFDLRHRLTKDGALAVEGFETRVWVVRDADRPGLFKSQPIPPEVVAKLAAGRGDHAP